MKLSDMTNPLLVVRGYIWDTFKQIDPDLATRYKAQIPIYPITDAKGGGAVWKKDAYFIYNTVYARPSQPFYPIKTELVHYVLKGDAQQTFAWSRALQVILDRTDDAAKDVNEWNANNMQANVFFHNFRVYQVEQARGSDYIEDQSITTDMIIKMTYHYTETLDDILNR